MYIVVSQCFAKTREPHDLYHQINERRDGWLMFAPGFQRLFSRSIRFEKQRNRVITTKLLKPIQEMRINGFGSVTVQIAGNKDHALQFMLKLFERPWHFSHNMPVCKPSLPYTKM